MVYLAPQASPGRQANAPGPPAGGPPAGSASVDAAGPPLSGMPEGAGPGQNPDLAPADGAQGPPASENIHPGDETREMDWVEQHLMHAGEFWKEQARIWETMKDPRLDSLIGDARSVAESVPEMGELAPPLPDVVILVSNELGLYDRAREQGLDVSAIELELEDFLEGRR